MRRSYDLHVALAALRPFTFLADRPKATPEAFANNLAGFCAADLFLDNPTGAALESERQGVVWAREHLRRELDAVTL